MINGVRCRLRLVEYTLPGPGAVSTSPNGISLHIVRPQLGQEPSMFLNPGTAAPGLRFV